MTKKSVLAVEDGITMRLFYRDVLEKAGFVVEEAANGVEGLERALMTRFDLMVVDINMPKMNGYEMVRQVRGNPALRSIPVLTVSTEEKDDDVVKAYEAGANFYLVKPVRPDELTAVVRLLTGSIS
ncbi:response regulator [Rhodoplanes serenus]|uniref:response regulator n=1 Tax=Rhodoplanes serenus TaxID=200615 RepID=UPI000DAED2C3|nr:response regulator [Rhodoplanes serenus]RAI37003.1 two-component system response regulator [Rhodoplanes serenus]